MTLSHKKVFFICLTLAWFVFDRASKLFFVNALDAGDSWPVLGGLFEFILVKNTGAAWGLFGNASVALGVFSLLVVLVLIIFFAKQVDRLNLAQVIGLALVVSGGLGNALDRFTQGWVTDFIAATFIDFPVFNVADIGVTCGVVILLIGFLVAWKQEEPNAKS